MKSPKKYDNAQLFRLAPSRTLFKIEVLIVAMVYATLLLFHQQYNLLPSFIVVSLLTFIYFARFSILVRFPRHLQVEFRTAPDRLICYHQERQTSYPLSQIRVYQTRYCMQLTLGRFPREVHLTLLEDSFENRSYYAAFRRYMLEKQELTATR